MDIIIKKSTSDTYWYANKIGDRYEVISPDGDTYKVKLWTSYPRDYMVAPVLKDDCLEIIGKSYPETRKASHWKAKNDKIRTAEKSAERSGFNTSQEIKRYEDLNRQSPIVKEEGK